MGILLQACSSPVHWQDELGSVLDEFGHRNWIVVADYAYPSQSAPGIETLFTGRDHLEVLDYVLGQIASAPHIRPKVMVDRELGFLSVEDAPGIEKYRSELDERLQGMEVTALPHEEIIRELDAASKLFRVMILKTNMTLPYTSVFIELDCGYWDAEREKRLRDSISGR
jgi:L-fucose mutarotase/ribose pyranase (RbsD/FucU family)